METENEGIDHEAHQGQPHIPVDPRVVDYPIGLISTVSRGVLHQGSGEIFLDNFGGQHIEERDVADPHHLDHRETADQQFEHIVPDVVRNQCVPVVQIQVPRRAQLWANPTVNIGLNKLVERSVSRYVVCGVSLLESLPEFRQLSLEV
jgi:hypothetical protein